MHLAGRRRTLKAGEKNEVGRVTPRLGNVWTLSFGLVWFSLTTVISLSLTIGLNRPFGDKTAQTSFLPGTRHSLSVPLTRPTTGQLTSPSLKYFCRLRFVCERKRLRLVKSSLFCKTEENRGLVVTRDDCHTHYISPTRGHRGIILAC